MQVRYTSDLRPIQVMKFFFPRSGVHTIAKQTDEEQVFFQFLMLNISSIKELLHKPSEIQ